MKQYLLPFTTPLENDIILFFEEFCVNGKKTVVIPAYDIYLRLKCIIRSNFVVHPDDNIDVNEGKLQNVADQISEYIRVMPPQSLESIVSVIKHHLGKSTCFERRVR